jgi:hypothetical protein
MHRFGPQPQAVHYSYEKAGLTLYDEAIPWNAELVRVEVVVRFPPSQSRRKTDFQLKLPGHGPILAESMRRQEADDGYRLVFRLPLPAGPVTAQFLWRQHRFGQLTLPFVSREEFLQKIQLQMPTLFVRLEDQSVACQTFVSSQCCGLMASGVIISPTSLVPLLDLGLHVEFRSGRGGIVQTVPAQLSASQLAGRQTLVAIVPRRLRRRIGTWIATWLLADRALATQRVRAISLRHFYRSLRMADTRFIIQSGKGKVTLARQLPPLQEVGRAGPCFLVTSQEPGMAGMAPFQVRVQVAGAVKPPELMDQEVLITDGPTMVAPGTLDISDLDQITAFELRLKGETLGVLATSPIPTASFTAEGGFRPPQEFSWTTAADEELTERLNRLLEERGQSK